MVMDLSENNALTKNQDKWVSDGLESVRLSFVNNINQLKDSESYEPGFVYQHFGENETIFGYEGLEINIIYSDLSLYVYSEINYKAMFKGDDDLKPDNVTQLLTAQLPEDQMNMMVHSKQEFQTHLLKQKSFKPFGEMIEKFPAGSKTFEMYKVSESSIEFDKFLTRAQTIALWYIEAATYTDNTDEHWLHYILYEECTSEEGDGSKFRKFAGYATLYRYYAYPDKIRPRIAQILLLPQYRGKGNGARFLQKICKNLWNTSNVMDITVEDPADSFIYLRDYVDCINCLGLNEFSPQNLKKGFSDEMKNAALEKFKICRKQARRVYEILRFKSTNKNDAEELKSYRIDVKRRLHAPMRKTEKDWKRLNTALKKEELIQAAAGEMDETQKMALLQQLYEQTVKEYQNTIERLEKYPLID